MTDNITLNDGAGGDVLAADDIGGVKHQRVKLQYGANNAATDVALTTPLPVTDWHFQVNQGAVTGYAAVNIKGHAPSMGTASQTFWNNASVVDLGLQDSAATVKVASTNANDTSAGTGARTVNVIGLDASNVLQVEAVTMNGQTEVTTSNTFAAVNGLVAATFGSTASNEGDIWCGNGSFTSGIPATKYHMMETAFTISHSAVYTCAAGKEAYFYSFLLMIADTAKSVEVLIKVYDGTARRTIAHLAAVAGSIEARVYAATALTAGQVLYFEGAVSTSTADVSIQASLVEVSV